jgi:Tfp pilus assembly protein PilF
MIGQEGQTAAETGGGGPSHKARSAASFPLAYGRTPLYKRSKSKQRLHRLNAHLKACLCIPPLLVAGILCAQTTAPNPKPESQLLTIEGQVQVLPTGTTQWLPARTNQVLQFGDRLRTGERSRATVRLSDLSVSRIDELTTFQIRPPQQPGSPSVLEVHPGSLYFLSRERPAQQQFRTPLTSGAIRGTEFNLTVAEDGATVVSLLDGAVTLSNQLGQVSMVSGEQGTVEPGKAPVKSPMLEAINIIQWCLYYPGVLDPKELELTQDERQALAPSLSAYASGDLLQAVALLPTNQPPGSDSERVYRAAALLSAGQAGQAEALLAQVQTNASRPAQLGTALREVMAVVKNQSAPGAAPAHLATEWLAESYFFQSRGQLKPALEAARAAVAKSPDFGFAWARVAELELSFGRRGRALEAVNKSLELSPRNAQALAVKGFILLGENRVREAQETFDHAITVDGALGNAWLGRGLCKVQRGEAEAGRQDMQVAAVQEPQRAIFRSYLGKAFSNASDNRRALKELGLAQKLDSNDPTAWLYSALIEEQQNEINPAVRDLEKSKELNDNQRLFRSKLLLDQDQAVRGADLANIYQDTGLITWDKGVAVSDWSVREASRAVSYDYANFSSHQFLANSYDALRDPRQINLRWETPWYSELLMANLLAPVGAGNLSAYGSEQPYARLFEQNHFGASSDTEYLTHGDFLERASQYATWGPASYAVDGEYHYERGWRPNDYVEQFTGTIRAKDQLTSKDSILVEGTYYNARFGDVAQYYNEYGTLTNAHVPAPSHTFHGEEKQWPELDQPNVFVGYNHEWAPGIHTLFLAGHLTDELSYTDPQASVPFIVVRGGQVSSISSRTLSVDLDRSLIAYTAELQQIWQTEHQIFVAGARYQSGDVYATSTVNNPNSVPPLISAQTAEGDLDHYSVYGYETIKPFDGLDIIGGITWDRLRYPVDLDTSPISSQDTEIDQISPKAGFILSPWDNTHLRFGYTRSLGGVFYDTSVRLEPTEVAGFNQAYRSLIPESVVGLVPGTSFTTYSVGLDQSFKTHTYLSLVGEILDSEGDRIVGAVQNAPGVIIPVPRQATSTPQHLDYTEQSLVASASQLLGNQWSLGARYQLSHAIYKSTFTDIPASIADGFNQDQDPIFQQLYLYVNYYHPCGFFSQFQSIWTGQHNGGPTSPGPGDYFWQFNLYAGYRFLHRAAEVRVGLLNLTDQNYMLNPVNLYYDLPRERTVSLSLKLYF